MGLRSFVLCTFVLAAPLLPIAGGLTSTAHAQLVRHEEAPPEIKEIPLGQELANAVLEGLGKSASPDALEQGIPQALLYVAQARFNPSFGLAAALDGFLKRNQDYMQSFNERWAAIQQRQQEVEAAVQKARGLGSDHQGARKALEAVLTGISANEEGKIEGRKEILTLMDAELPALYELASVARDSGDLSILPDIAAAFCARRHILDKTTESLVWLAAAGRIAKREGKGGTLGNAGFGLPNSVSRAIEHIEEVQNSLVREDGMRTAHEFFNSIDRYGMSKGKVSKPESVPLSGYALFELQSGPGMSLTVDDTAVTFQLDWREHRPFNCRETNKADGYNPVTRKFTYRHACQVKENLTQITLKAALRAPPPKWAKAPLGPVWVVGKVKQAPKASGEDNITGGWVLTDAQVVDFRFFH